MVNLAGLVFVLFGLPMALFPYRVAKLSEGLDAIGSTRDATTVEPAGWNVHLTRVVGVVLVVVGLLYTLAG